MPDIGLNYQFKIFGHVSSCEIYKQFMVDLLYTAQIQKTFAN